MSRKTCPFCNRVLVEKSDQSQLCMFCGWKSTAPVKKQVRKTDQNLSQPQEKKTGKLSEPAPARKKSGSQAKIITSAEDIARQQLQQENSRQQVTWVTVAAVVVLGLVAFQMCRPSTPEVEPEAVMTPVAQESLLSPSPLISPSAPSFVIQTPLPQLSPTMTPAIVPTPTSSASTPASTASPSETASSEPSAVQVSPPPVEATPTAVPSPS